MFANRLRPCVLNRVILATSTNTVNDGSVWAALLRGRALACQGASARRPDCPPSGVSRASASAPDGRWHASAEYPAAAWDRQAPVASSTAAYRKIPRRHRPAGVGRLQLVRQVRCPRCTVLVGVLVLNGRPNRNTLGGASRLPSPRQAYLVTGSFSALWTSCGVLGTRC